MSNKLSIDPNTAHTAKCPKGKFSYSPHRFKTIVVGHRVKGIQVDTLECKLCGGVTTSTLDYNVLRGIF